MTGYTGVNPVTHFGRQMRKERLARAWSLREMHARTEIAAGHLSRIENGLRPPTQLVADACDRVFPERKGWFREYYDESRSWTPPGLRSWAEHEDKAVRLSVWAPCIIHGLFQTEDYARTLIAVLPGVTDEVVSARLVSRLERQRRVLYRDDPPLISCVIDHAALYRLVDSPEVMANQMRHLVQISAMPNVTLTVMPSVAHPATSSELIIADNNAVYAEHLVSGGVYPEDETVARLERLFAKLQGECYRVSESLVVIRKAEEIWTGVRPPTAGLTDRA